MEHETWSHIKEDLISTIIAKKEWIVPDIKQNDNSFQTCLIK